MGTAQSEVSTGRHSGAVGIGAVGERLKQAINARANKRRFYLVHSCKLIKRITREKKL